MAGAWARARYRMLIQEVVTDLEPAEVVRRAKEFFTTRFSNRSAFVEEESESHVKFEIEAGELLIGTSRQGDRTTVRGSTSRAHSELSRFLITLGAAPEEVRQNLPGPGASGAG
jgi:hypothetical protein